MVHIALLVGSAVLSMSQAGEFPGWEESDRIECDGNYIETVRVKSGEERNAFLRILGPEGNHIHPLMVFSGSIVDLCEFGAFLLIDDSYQYAPGPSFLMNKTGNVVDRFDFGEIRSVGVSDDHKLFWVQSSVVRAGEPATRVRIFDYTGEQLSDLEKGQGGKVDIQYESGSYEIDVLAPEWPG